MTGVVVVVLLVLAAAIAWVGFQLKRIGDELLGKSPSPPPVLMQPVDPRVMPRDAWNGFYANQHPVPSEPDDQYRRSFDRPVS